MRIISGLAGGISLSVPKGEVRPTTDRVREALFSILHPLIKHADVLDLFSGSGAFGLEALSRGARTARMVDASRASCTTAKANLSKTGLEGGTVIQGDAVQFVKRELTAGRKYGRGKRPPAESMMWCLPTLPIARGRWTGILSWNWWKPVWPVC